MNERIRKLADEAGINIWYDEDSGQEVYSGESAQVLAKFAELIVRECADFVDQNTLENQGMWGKIMRHFGVEE